MCHLSERNDDIMNVIAIYSSFSRENQLQLQHINNVVLQTDAVLCPYFIALSEQCGGECSMQSIVRSKTGTWSIAYA